MKRQLKISIIIPAYNEERHLGACLASIAAQTVKPYEVIVVDNASTDNTAAIASQYSFVKLVYESKPGLIAARNRGFDVAKGDVLGRLNADVVLKDDWVKHITRLFAEGTIAGLTGPASTVAWPDLRRVRTTIWSYGYLFGAEAFFGVRVLWGANMAITRDAWLQIKSRAHTDDTFVHEDQDLSLLIAGIGGRITSSKDIVVSTDEQSYFYWPKLKEYWLRRWRTKKYHKRRGTYDVAYRLPYGSLFWRLPFMVGNLIFAGVSLLYYGMTQTIVFMRRLVEVFAN